MVNNNIYNKLVYKCMYYVYQPSYRLNIHDIVHIRKFAIPLNLFLYYNYTCFIVRSTYFMDGFLFSIHIILFVN